LQRTIGNAAFAALVAQGPPRQVQRALSLQRDKVDDAVNLLSYGAVDWAVTDSESIQAFNLLKSAPGTWKAVCDRLGEKYCDRLLDNMPKHQQFGTAWTQFVLNCPAASISKYLDGLDRGKSLLPAQKTLLYSVFKGLPDGQLALLKKIFEVRWDVTVGKDTTETTGVEWDAPGLRRSMEVFTKLPPAHVEGNPDFTKYLRYDEGGGMGGGYYSASDEAASLNYTSGQATMDETNVSEAGDALQGVNRFNKVVRHEVGHAVDESMGWSDGAEPKNASRGAWKQYGSDADTAFEEMIAASGGAISTLTSDQKDDVVTAMEWCAANKKGSDLIARIKKKYAWYSALKSAKRAQIKADPVVSAFAASLVGQTPWYSASNGGVALGGRVFQESYKNDWSSYEQASRARKVSQYQFRAPGEWFAEAYAAYYEPDARGRGAALNAADPDSKKYFDESVHKFKH
jgi:hypothetical protein